MLREMTARQWMEWSTFHSFHVRAVDKEQFRFAQICKAIWDTHYARAGKRNPKDIYEYVNAIRFGDDPERYGSAPTRRQSPKEQGQMLKLIFSELAAHAKKKGPK